MTAEQIGMFIQQQRVAVNMTQKELADKVPIRRQAIIEIENAKCDYGIGILLEVLSALGFTLMPTIELSRVTKSSVMFDFAKIEPAQDPTIETKKRQRIKAHTNVHYKK